METATRSTMDESLATLASSQSGNSPDVQPDSFASSSESNPSLERVLIPNHVDEIGVLFAKLHDSVGEWLVEDQVAHNIIESTSHAQLRDKSSITNELFSTQIRAEGTLEGITAALDAMFHERSPPVMALLQRALSALADILRYGAPKPPSNADFRDRFRDSGIVDFCLEVIKQCNDLLRAGEFPVYAGVLHQAFRVVGNSVISHDNNRARVVAGNYTKPMINILMHTKSISALQDTNTAALSVLNNVCMDNEPAQEQVIQNEIIPILWQTLQSGNDGEIHVTTNLIEMVSKHSQSHDLSPDHILDKLIELALRRDIQIDEFLTLTTAMMNYLKSVRFQEHLIEIGAIENVYDLISHRTLQKFDDESPEEKEELAKNCLALVSAISDCCDLPEFEKRNSILSTQSSADSLTISDSSPPLTDRLVHLISSQYPDDVYIQLLGCILTGNFARSEESCRALLDGRVHDALVETLLKNEDGRVLHSALGALKNLAIPSPLRERLADSDVFDGVSRIWDMRTMPQVQLGSVTLVRLLCTKCIPNITNHLLRSSAAIHSPPEDEETCLSRLLILFSRTDSLPIRLEIGRTIAEVFRCLGSAVDLDRGGEEAYDRLFTHRHLSKPISAMLTQSQYSPVRSEGLFTLALISRQKKGCMAIQAILQDASVFEVLVDTITGKIGKETKDRENVLVMASEMVRSGSDELLLSAEDVEILIQGLEAGKVYQNLEERLEGMKVKSGRSETLLDDRQEE